MKKLLALLAIALIASSAMAQVDPDPDGVGVYFDLGGTTFEKNTVAPFESVTAYLLVTNPSDPAGVAGWEMVINVAGGAVAPAWTLSAGLDVDSDPNAFQVGIGLAPLALPAGPTVLLATWVGFVMAPTDVISFTILPVPGSVSFDNAPGYASGDNAGLLIPLQVSSGFPYGAPSALINSTGVVANENMSFGQVKNLFQ